MSAKIIIKYNRLPKIAARLPNAVGKIISKAALDIEAHAKQAMSGPRSGRIYKRGSRIHQASAPGEPPAVDTGKLKNSIRSEQIAVTKAIVSASAEYAAYLEFGTRRMAARPYMRPAVEAVTPMFFSALHRLEEKLQ